MKASKANTTLSYNNFIAPKFSTEKQNTTHLIDLHYKSQDEPDFDCEFLHAVAQDYPESERMIDSDEEESLIDDYHDNDWDSSIYDPYKESAYF